MSVAAEKDKQAKLAKGWKPVATSDKDTLALVQAQIDAKRKFRDEECASPSLVPWDPLLLCPPPACERRSDLGALSYTKRSAKGRYEDASQVEEDFDRLQASPGSYQAVPSLGNLGY